MVGLVAAREGNLPRQADGPDDDGEGGHDAEADVAARAAVHEFAVKDQETDHQRADDSADDRREQRTAVDILQRVEGHLR